MFVPYHRLILNVVEEQSQDVAFVRRVTDLDEVEARVLGCLIEKQRTTPDSYPLTLNALRLACNQSTNRSPVVDYDEDQIHTALQGLGRRELTRNASGHGSRASKYRHLVDDRLVLDGAQQAVLCVLLLRGAQTPGELKTRTERLHDFDGIDEVEAVLGSLIERGMAEQLSRRPGEKQVRYRQLLTGDDEFEPEREHNETGSRPAPDDELVELRARVERLEAEFAELRDRL